MLLISPLLVFINTEARIVEDVLQKIRKNSGVEEAFRRIRQTRDKLEMFERN